MRSRFYDIDRTPVRAGGWAAATVVCASAIRIHFCPRTYLLLFTNELIQRFYDNDAMRLDSARCRESTMPFRWSKLLFALMFFSLVSHRLFNERASWINIFLDVYPILFLSIACSDESGSILRNSRETLRKSPSNGAVSSWGGRHHIGVTESNDWQMVFRLFPFAIDSLFNLPKRRIGTGNYHPPTTQQSMSRSVTDETLMFFGRFRMVFVATHRNLCDCIQRTSSMRCG